MYGRENDYNAVIHFLPPITSKMREKFNAVHYRDKNT